MTIATAVATLFLGAAAPGHAAPRVLRVCDDVAPPLTLDPTKEFAEKNHTLVQQMFDGLVRLDPAGRLEPALATAWKRVDPLTTEFSLREGVAFHDGEPFDGGAVKFSLERLMDPKTGFPAAGFLGSIESVSAAGPYVVRIKTRFPDGLLLHRLAGFVTIVPPKRLAEHGDEAFARRPVGTGAFRFVSADTGKIVLEANRGYWGEDRRRYDRLEFVFLPAEAQVRGLLEGEVDIVTELPGTETLRVMKSGVARIVKKETFYTVGASVNLSSGPLADRRVRQAVNYAIDKDALVRYDVLGNGRPLGSLSMAGELGHDPGIRPYPYDPKKAKELLRAAGYPSGLRLRAVVKAQGERTMRVIATHLKKVGIELDLVPTTDATVIQDIQRDGWDFTFGGCPDPLAHSFFIQWVFLSSQSPYSLTRLPEYDRRLAALVTTIEPAEQDRLGRELDRFIHDEALGLFTYQRLKTYGVRKGVRFTASVTGMPYFHLSRPDE